MSAFPHTALFFGSGRTTAISGPHIQVLDSKTGELLATTADLGGDELQALLKTGAIRCAAIDPRNEHIVVSADDKVIRVYLLDGLRLLSSREAPKKPTSIAFSQNGQTIVISDKFGDIFSYPLHPTATPISLPPAVKTELASHENPAGGKLILGHTSLLTTFALTQDEKYIITADRDEHIRVSWYPQGYVIESYCLGHEKFVSAIHVPLFDPDTLISGGGDPVLKVWDWSSGKLKYNIPILDVVKPFIKVLPQKSKDAWASATSENGPTQLQGRKGRAKAKKAKEDAQAAAAASPSLPDVAKQTTEDAPTATEPRETEGAFKPETDPVLAIQKIITVDVPSSGRRILFSAVGATALFIHPYSIPVPTQPGVKSIDFHKPILDFILADSGHIWVLTDGEWQSSSSITDSSITDLVMVHVARWDGDELIQLSAKDPSISPLLTKLNSNCLIQANADQIKQLELYAALTSLPKTQESEPDAREDGHNRGEASGNMTPADVSVRAKGKALSGKEIARAKNRKAIQERLKIRDVLDGEEPPFVSGEDGALREVKRTRSDNEEPDSDVNMVES